MNELEIYACGRGGGKTHHAVLWTLAAPDRVLVVYGPDRVRWVEESWPEMRGRVITTTEAISKRFPAGRRVTLALDNVDDYLWRQFGADIGMITWNAQDVRLSQSPGEWPA